MKEKIEAKLEEMEKEHAKGLKIVNQLRVQLEDAQMTVLRVEGAITACRELLKAEEPVLEMDPPADVVAANAVRNGQTHM